MDVSSVNLVRNPHAGRSSLRVGGDENLIQVERIEIRDA
jgi:hypothetical protein